MDQDFRGEIKEIEEKVEEMSKKTINLDKEYECSTDNWGGLSIETGKYIINVKSKQILDIIGTSCKKLLIKNE